MVDDVENWEEERRRWRIGELKKKAISASCRFTHSLKKKNKRRGKIIDYRVPIEDVRDEQEESAVLELRQTLLHRGFMPPNHDDYHTLLRSLFTFLFYLLIYFIFYFCVCLLLTKICFSSPSTSTLRWSELGSLEQALIFELCEWKKHSWKGSPWK